MPEAVWVRDGFAGESEKACIASTGGRVLTPYHLDNVEGYRIGALQFGFRSK